MALKVFTVYDSKSEHYGNPIFLLNKGEALRSFADEAKNPESMIGKHSADFTLFMIGEFDQATGTFKPLPAKENLGTAIELKGLN